MRKKLRDHLIDEQKLTEQQLAQVVGGSIERMILEVVCEELSQQWDDIGETLAGIAYDQAQAKKEKKDKQNKLVFNGRKSSRNGYL